MKKDTREKLMQDIFDRCRVTGKDQFRLADYDTAWAGPEEIKQLGEEKLKKQAKKILKKNLEALSEAQETFYAANKFSLLLIFQAMDAAGKDGTIKHVMSGVNPQGCQVFSFKKPSSEELDHNYLWKYTKKMPEFGRIGIFNRSYFEEVLVVKVNPEFLQGNLKDQNIDEAFWNARYEDINNLEKHLIRNNTLILKFFLNVSKEEQKNRFLERLNDPEKHWKFSDSDLVERSKWDKYQDAFEEAINHTATPWAPWFVIPADNKWIMRAIVSMIVTDTITSLKLATPEVSSEKKKLLDEARKELESQ
jgi:PPK2 family polyphosphate:nucleotide phosphotransferase